MPRANFTSENIVSLIESARKGGTQDAIIQRAGAAVDKGTLRYWLNKGEGDRKEGKRTALALFAEKYYEVNPKAGRSDDKEHKGMEAMQEALNILEGGNAQGVTAPTPPVPSKPKQAQVPVQASSTTPAGARIGRPRTKCPRPGCKGNLVQRTTSSVSGRTTITECRQCGHEVPEVPEVPKE